MPNWLLETQSTLTKFNPAFIKGFISILIGAFTFLQLFFSSDEALTYISAVTLFWLKGFIGLSAITLNQFRDALSAYYIEKGKTKLKVVDVELTKVYNGKPRLLHDI